MRSDTLRLDTDQIDALRLGGDLRLDAEAEMASDQEWHFDDGPERAWLDNLRFGGTPPPPRPGELEWWLTEAIEWSDREPDHEFDADAEERRRIGEAARRLLRRVAP